MKCEDALRVHSDAAARLVETAKRIRTDAWLAPYAEGKWSPAEVVEHLNATYDVLTRELEGGAGMKILTTFWQRLLLRLTIYQKILRKGAFPKGARAPREIRPANPNPDQTAAISTFQERSARFHSVAVEKHQTAPRTMMSHAYFGRGSIAEGVLLAARHIQHHEQQLAALR